MNKNTLLGFAALFLLLTLHGYLSQPPQEEVERWNRYQDSIKKADIAILKNDSLQKIKAQALLDSIQAANPASVDSIKQALLKNEFSDKFGDFGVSAQGENGIVSLENDKLKLNFSRKGGRLVGAEIKGFLGYEHGTPDNAYDKKPVVLFDNPRNRFNYQIPNAAAKRKAVNSEDLYFEPRLEGKKLSLRAYASADKTRYFEQEYTIGDDYVIDYKVRAVGLLDLMELNNASIRLDWHTFLNKVEKSDHYERTMSSIHYKEMEENPNYCTCAASIANEQHQVPLKWVSQAQQFFNIALMGQGGTVFAGGTFNTFMSPGEESHLKELKADLVLPPVAGTTMEYNLRIYAGPNDYDILTKVGDGLESVIPFGWSIFGGMNKYLIRPLFNFLALFMSSYGMIIIILTLIIRLVIYPLQYKMLYSGVKMSLLKPELDEMRAKNKDNPQAMQMEQMKLYQQYGVNPLGGCLPMLLTMPVWIALYRFFPASIEFRQKSFLWADDLSSYDSILDFGYIPFIDYIYGDHVSLFTLGWAVSMFAFLKYNSSQMDMNAGGNPGQMKMMMTLQYGFPVLFFFALNSWAAGLTAYMLLSNLLNIAQTYITKNFVINKEKVRAEMEETKRNPKTSGWQQKYEEMMRQAQQQQQNKK